MKKLVQHKHHHQELLIHHLHKWKRELRSTGTLAQSVTKQKLAIRLALNNKKLPSLVVQSVAGVTRARAITLNTWFPHQSSRLVSEIFQF